MVSEVTDSFRPLGQLLSIIGTSVYRLRNFQKFFSGRTELYPIVGEFGFNAGLAWKLDAHNLHPSVKGALPYTLVRDFNV